MDSLCRSKTYVQAIVRYGGVYWGLGIVRDALPGELARRLYLDNICVVAADAEFLESELPVWCFMLVFSGVLFLLELL